MGGQQSCPACNNICDTEDICGGGTTWNVPFQKCILDINPSTLCGENMEWNGAKCQSTLSQQQEQKSIPENARLELGQLPVNSAPELPAVTPNEFDALCPFGIFDNETNACGKTNNQLTVECIHAHGGLDMQTDLNSIVTCVYGKQARCANLNPTEFAQRMTRCVRFKIGDLGNTCDENGIPGEGDQSCEAFWNNDRLYRAFQTGGLERICGGQELDIQRKNIWDNCTSFRANECPDHSGCAKVDPWNLGGLLLAKAFVEQQIKH